MLRRFFLEAFPPELSPVGAWLILFESQFLQFLPIPPEPNALTPKVVVLRKGALLYKVYSEPVSDVHVE
jgi:hypothetical protein